MEVKSFHEAIKLLKLAQRLGFVKDNIPTKRGTSRMENSDTHQPGQFRNAVRRRRIHNKMAKESRRINRRAA